jgi:putative acyl-CoA dehydrogenase
MSATASQRKSHRTHEVLNQPPPLVGHNVYAANLPLREALAREGGGWAEERVLALGELAGGEEAIRWGFEANEQPPELRAFDRYGNRIDEIRYHPSYHRLMEVSVAHELHCLPWREQRPGAHAARAALFMTWNVDAGHTCPISMTFSALPALRAQPELAAQWEPRILSAEYDPRLLPAADKRGAMLGMAMTEKQGGSDVRANTTTARALDGGGSGAEHEVTGHKWFCSAAMSDAFLILAQAEGGLSCFLLPRLLEDGAGNGFHVQRVKDKLGNRSNASSEVELDAARAWMVGEPGRGVPTIIEMVNHTRLDCLYGAAAGMRYGVEQATWHAAHRAAFGKLLDEQPLMRNVLADLCVESEAATVTAMRLARAYDEAAAGDAGASHLKRIATAVAKFWVCKRWPTHAAEALECLGGNGYAEESGLPRLFRESPLNSLWEGTANVQCLDVLRAMAREPETVPAFFAELEEAAGAEPRLDAYVESLRSELSHLGDAEARARRIVERMALALQGSLLVRHSPPAVVDAFCASRLAGDHGGTLGTLPPALDFAAIVERHRVGG